MLLRTEVVSYPDEQARSLADALKRDTAAEVRFDEGSRALYSTDASNYRQIPIGVVIPKSVDDAVAAINVCRAHDAPILARGGGTSLAGQTCNVAVVLDFSKHVNRILDLDVENKCARVEPGLIFDHLRTRAEEHGLTVAFDTSTHDRATIGGMLGNNSCGVHSVLAQTQGAGSGRAVDNTDALEVVTYDGLRLRVGRTPDAELERLVAAGGRTGELYAGMRALRDRYAELIRARYPDIPRRVSGYNLNQLLPEHGFDIARLLVGSEGTLATTLEATVKLMDSPPARSLLVLGFSDIYAAADRVPEVMAAGPVGCEAIDRRLVANMRAKDLHAEDIRMLPDGDGWLLVEFGGRDGDEAVANAKRLLARLERSGSPPTHALFADSSEQETIWAIREAGLGATAFVPGRHDNWPGWEDSAVPPERFGAYLRELDALFDRYGYGAALYGHFGQGLLHCRIDFDLGHPDGVAKWRAFLSEAAELVTRFDGSLSGEHGDGQARAELLEIMYGPELVGAFRELKGLWDPAGKMNPGKVVDPYPVDSHLRLRADQRPRDLDTWFRYPDDGGSFSRAILRCVGVGKCRHWGGGVMCPSFMATHDEKDCTRGRSRALFEMIHGNLRAEGWRSEAVKETLDLCLACKGCKRDCPVNVDMATYKAEFMAHYYKGRLRPRSAYILSQLPFWTRVTAPAPKVANAFTQWRGLRRLAKAGAGVAPSRELPVLARRPFKHWFARHEPSGNSERGEVVLFPDTFTNRFHPHIGRDAVHVLEQAGWRVRVPEPHLCCGRPVYDKGFLDQGRRMLRKLIDTLVPEVDAGRPVVVLEPACAAAFRDELVNLWADDPAARRLSEHTFLFSEFLEREGFDPPSIRGRALLHLHCNHHAMLDPASERTLLERLGLEVDKPDSGCCGMAGSFGLEAETYEVSLQCGERVLLPAVRATASDTLVVSSGFSCREQIRQTTDRRALHPAEVVLRAQAADQRG